MFAGGGTQHPGMGASLYRDEPVYARTADACLALLSGEQAAQVRAMLVPGIPGADAASIIQRPSIGLPALFISQYAQAQLWLHWGITPAGLIGHSMGEYTAACLAGVFSLRDALALVCTRARLFETVSESAMLSVPLGAGELQGFLGAELSIAAANAPALSVASGPVSAIEHLSRTLAARGIESSRLRINVAAHSRLLEPILGEFRAFVRQLDLRPPTLPVVSNLNGRVDDRGGSDGPGVLGAAPARDGSLLGRPADPDSGRRHRPARGGPGPHAGHARPAAGRIADGGSGVDAEPG